MKFSQTSAMTLTELIIASVLVGIVTLGLIGAEEAIRMSRQSSNRDAQVSAQIQAAMIALSNDANLTVGDSTDAGIYQYAVNNDLTICFRQASGDPNKYSDDLWNCWWADKASGVLSSCGKLGAPVNTCQGQTNQNWGTLVFDATYTTFYSVFDDNSTLITPQNPWFIKNTKISSIHLSLKSRFAPALASHPIENPEYTLSSNISPEGLSR